jgi:hypothetical protein
MENDFDSKAYNGKKNRIEFWKFHVNSWLTKKSVFFISFEKLRYSYKKSVIRLGKYLNLCPNKPRV